jgi:hypothetical protein
MAVAVRCRAELLLDRLNSSARRRAERHRRIGHKKWPTFFSASNGLNNNNDGSDANHRRRDALGRRCLSTFAAQIGARQTDEAPAS